MTEKIAAIVVTYNRKELLSECISAIKQQSIHADIIVVDNASTDGTANMSIFNAEDIYYYNTGKNIGGAGGFNYGIRKAYEKGYDYMWIMDDDTIPKQDALEKLFIAACEKKDFGFLVSMALWTDGNECVMNRPGIADLADKSRHTRLEWATFVSLFVKKEIIQQVGLPIKEFFIWGDDREYTKRITAKYSAYFVPESKVVHKMNNNCGSDISIDIPDRIDRYVYAFRNEHYIARYSQRKIKELCKYYRYVLGTIKAIILCAPNYKLRRISKVIKGMWKGLFFNPRIEKVE